MEKKEISKNQNQQMSDNQEKKALRRQGLSQRDKLGEASRKLADLQILDTICQQKAYAQASLLLVYVNYKSEVNTTQLIQKAFFDGKRVAVPKVTDKNGSMEFYEIESLGELEKGYQGILEPVTAQKESISPEKEFGNLLMILPGAAFDCQGNRIGYGGGFYDRYLREHPVKGFYTMAVCYEVQVVDHIPADLHDFPVNCIITEKRRIDCETKGKER